MEVGGNGSNLAYSVEERPPIWLTLALGLQHVILIYGEIVVFPVIIGKAAGAPAEHIQFACFAAGLACGMATLLQVFRIGRMGSGYALFMGSSAAYFAGSVEVLKAGGFPLLATLSILVAPIEMLFSYFLRFFRHIVTPAVGGVVLLLIVFNLVPVGLHEWVGDHDSLHHGSPANLAVGLITLVTLLGMAMLGGRVLKLWCPILGLGAGMVSAWAMGLLNLSGVSEQPWFGLGGGSWPGLALEIKPEHLSLLATMAVLTVINSVQAIGNSMAVQQVSERSFRKVDYDSVQGAMYADGAGNILSGLLGTVPNETYCENISVLKVTGVASRVVGLCGGLLLIGLSFSPKVGMFVAQMPDPVFGGFIIGLAAMMFPSGLSLVFSHGITHQSGLLVGLSLCLGLVAQTKHFFPELLPSSLEVFLHNGVATGGLTAFILSSIFYVLPKKGLSFRLRSSLEELPHLIREVERAGERMKAPSEMLFNLQLACEEVFAHLVGQAQHGQGERKIAFRIHRDEHGVVVELISGESVEDFDDKTMPEDLMACRDDDLQNMGLALLHKVANTVRHLEISGVTYLSFTMPVPTAANG